MAEDEEDADLAVKVIQKEEEQHEANMVKFLQRLIEGRLTRTLLRMVADIDNELRGPESFPVLVGSYKQLTKPALEFVKVVCGVLKLDPGVEEQVVVLRRQLLAQLGIKEFADEGKSTDYCRYVRLSFPKTCPLGLSPITHLHYYFTHLSARSSCRISFVPSVATVGTWIFAATNVRTSIFGYIAFQLVHS